MGRVLVVEALGFGRRDFSVDGGTRWDQWRPWTKDAWCAEEGAGLPPLAADGLVGGVLSVIHCATARSRGGHRSSSVTGPLMSMIVLPYLGAAAAGGSWPEGPSATRRTNASAPPPIRCGMWRCV